MNTLLKKTKNQNYKICRYKAQNALQSGFQAQEANKNLKAAESILNELKNNITDENLKKSFEKITNEVFWTGALIEGTHYLQLVEKVVKGWEITNKLEKYITEKFYNIVHNAQQQYIQDELVKIENEKKELIELGSKIVQSRDGSGTLYNTTYGDPNNDPTIMINAEKEYKLKHLFDEKQLSNKERAEVEANKFRQKYKDWKEMPEGTEKKKAAIDFWNELTDTREDSETMLRKWEHVKRWLSQPNNKVNPQPYYVEEYNKYLKPYTKPNTLIIEGEAYRKELSSELKEMRQEINMKEILPYLKDEETGLYWYAGMLSPISLEDNPNIEYAAHQGSRFFESEGYYRLHAGQDMGSFKIPIEGNNIHSLINGTFLSGDEFTIETGDGYAIRYRHMLPQTYSQYKTGDKINVNDIVAQVGGWSARRGPHGYDPHLHFDILKKGVVINDKTKKPVIDSSTGLPKQAYNIALDPSQVEIRGGKIYEKK